MSFLFTIDIFTHFRSNRFLSLNVVLHRECGICGEVFYIAKHYVLYNVLLTSETIASEIVRSSPAHVSGSELLTKR